MGLRESRSPRGLRRINVRTRPASASANKRRIDTDHVATAGRRVDTARLGTPSRVPSRESSAPHNAGRPRKPMLDAVPADAAIKGVQIRRTRDSENCSPMPWSPDQFDLRSLGNEGPVQAAQTYDPALGIPFGIFARYRVQGAMVDGLRAEDRHRRTHLEHLPTLSQLDDGVLRFLNYRRTWAFDILRPRATLIRWMAVWNFQAPRRRRHRPTRTQSAGGRRAPVRKKHALRTGSQNLDLHYVNGEDSKTIAITLGVSYATVRNYHRKVTTRLAAILRCRGIEEAPTLQ